MLGKIENKKFIRIMNLMFEHLWILYIKKYYYWLYIDNY